MTSQDTQALFEHLAATGLFVDTVEMTLARLGRDGRSRIISEIGNLLPAGSPSGSASIFDFTVGREFSGAPYRCSRFECRRSNLLELAKFAALYANSVVLPNPFEEPPHTPPLAHEGSIRVLADSLKLLYEIRPLLEASLIAFGPPTLRFCADCVSKGVTPDAAFARDLATLFETLVQQYESQITCARLRYDDLEALLVQGPDALIPHGQVIQGDYRLWAQSDSEPSQIVKLDASVTRQVLPSILATAVDDIYVQNWLARHFDCHFLTNSALTIDIVETIRTQERRADNGVLAQNFAHSIPFIDGAPLAQLLQLRRTEGEAFQVYRDALGKALAQSRGLDAKSLRALFKDVVRPEINRIEVLAKNSKRKSSFLLGAKAAIGLGTVAIGHFLHDSVAAMITDLGGSAIAMSALDAIREPDEIKKEPYYFLWRAQQIGKSES